MYAQDISTRKLMLCGIVYTFSMSINLWSFTLGIQKRVSTKLHSDGTKQENQTSSLVNS